MSYLCKQKDKKKRLEASEVKIWTVKNESNPSIQVRNVINFRVGTNHSVSLSPFASLSSLMNKNKTRGRKRLHSNNSYVCRMMEKMLLFEQ
jgi:hypothetical protein